MATKSSIHIKPCRVTSSGAHNRRTAEYMRNIGKSQIYIVHELTSPTDSLYDKIISNVRQVKARGGTVVAIITKGNDAMKDIADHCLEVPDVPECLTPLVVSVPLQLLAYYIAINKDRNVDQPRNLAKSVTVE